ncbi:hypothetical protein [Argonema antarcticum]|uniref:hypothetical protein n=1 Tax=Argonema antarcticum TaxID=2942763 RepID=UPI002013BF01|nr:hypothetical protein [Argonema antarcticum]MCL1475028.1 hypothetical protein [Argonema antarcticum A004/B2]
MSHLHLFLYLPEQVYQFIKLPASSVIETTLTISSNKASLPTLVSVENIIKEINAKGFELENSDQINKISSLVNNYLVTKQAIWQDQSLELNVTRISLQDENFYKEIQEFRNLTTNMVRQITYFENKNDSYNVKNVQDNAVKKLTEFVQSHPNWWDTKTGKLFKFFGQTAITTIWQRCIGTAFDTLISSIF